MKITKQELEARKQDALEKAEALKHNLGMAFGYIQALDQLINLLDENDTVEVPDQEAN